MRTAPSEHKLISSVAFYATWLFWVIIFVIGTGFYIVGYIFPASREFCVAIATSLISSLIFALIYSAIAEKHYLKATSSELQRSVQVAVDKIEVNQQENIRELSSLTVKKIEDIERNFYHLINTSFQRFLPSGYFPPTDKPDKRFNRELNGSLLQSQHYFFKGATGRHVPSRLEIAKHQIATCRVLLIDPNNEDLLRLYIRDRFGNPSLNTATTEQLERVKQEIYMTVVDLFTQAHRWCTVELRIFSGPVFYRTEIFDEKLYISYYAASAAREATAYPTTYLYDKSSLFYEVFMTDFNQTFDLTQQAITFNNRSREEDLKDFLQEIGCNPVQLPQLRTEAENFRSDFISNYC